MWFSLNSPKPWINIFTLLPVTLTKVGGQIHKCRCCSVIKIWKWHHYNGVEIHFLVLWTCWIWTLDKAFAGLILKMFSFNVAATRWAAVERQTGICILVSYHWARHLTLEEETIHFRAFILLRNNPTLIILLTSAFHLQIWKNSVTGPLTTVE